MFLKFSINFTSVSYKVFLINYTGCMQVYGSILAICLFESSQGIGYKPEKHGNQTSALEVFGGFWLMRLVQQFTTAWADTGSEETSDADF